MASEKIYKVELPDGTQYDIAGTSVTPNPEGAATKTEPLTKLTIEEDIWNIGADTSKIEEDLDRIHNGLKIAANQYSYKVVVEPPADEEATAEDCIVHLTQLLGTKVIDTFDGTLRSLGIGTGTGYADAAMWHDIALNTSYGTQYSIYSNINGLTYNGEIFNKGYVIYQAAKTSTTDITITNGTTIKQENFVGGGFFVNYDNSNSNLEATNIQDAINELATKPSGTEVIANPEAEATEELEKIKIGDTVFSIPEGGGGSTHKYSTEEKVVGEWIDGKPIYEKSGTTTVTKQTDNIIATIPNLKNIINCQSNVNLSRAIATTNYYVVGDDATHTYYEATTKNLFLYSSYDGECCWYIQYTKTTD